MQFGNTATGTGTSTVLPTSTGTRTMLPLLLRTTSSSTTRIVLEYCSYMYRDYGSAVSYKHWHYSSTRSSTAYSNTVQYCTPGTCTIDSTSTLDVQVLCT